MSPLIITVISVSCFLLSMFLYRKLDNSYLHKVSFCLLAYFSIAIYIFYIIADYFTGEGINEAVLFHLKYGLQGAGYLEYLQLFSITLSIVILTTVIIIKPSKNKKTGFFFSANNVKLIYVLILCSMLTSPASLDLYNNFYSSNQLSIRASDVLDKNNSQDESRANKNLSNTEDALAFSDYYRNPYIKGTARPAKNVIVIYAESLERTYFDEKLFPGLITHLREIENKSISFTNIDQVYATGITIGGITATQCGIPLITPSSGNSMSGMDQFLPSAICLGDLLSSQNYKLDFYGGARLKFAGKGKFFNSHGFTNVKGLDELSQKGVDSSYKSYWGLFDDTLLDIVYERFEELSKAQEKFGIFALTLDTHHPQGHKTKSCDNIKYKDGANKMLNSVKCSDFLISKFLNRIKDSKYSDETLIVVASDHLAMKNKAYSLLEKAERKNLFMIIDPSTAKAAKIDTLGSTLDFAPTLISKLGYQGEIGFGRNLLDLKLSSGEQAKIHENLKSWNKQLKKFWNFPKVKKSLEIKLNEGVVVIGKRKFKIPLLIELDINLSSTLYFQFDSSVSLVSRVNSFEQNENYLYIDKCNKVNELVPYLRGGELCLLIGKGKEQIKSTKITEDYLINSDDLRVMFNIYNGFNNSRVAHAGGGIQGETYTNSIDALNENIKKGFRYFEIDFSFTQDNKLVCLHDWNDSFNRSFGYVTNEKLSLKEFENIVKTKSKYQKCTLESLANWMVDNPSASIITDVKENNLLALKQLIKTLPSAKRRVIPQVYNPENLNTVKKLGYDNIIWTLYKYPGSNDDVISSLIDFDHPIAVTMPKGRAKTNLPSKLSQLNIPTYVHTINDFSEVDDYISNFGISEIYTDFIRP